MCSLNRLNLILTIDDDDDDDIMDESADDSFFPNSFIQLTLSTDRNRNIHSIVSLYTFPLVRLLIWTAFYEVHYIDKDKIYRHTCYVVDVLHGDIMG